MKKLGLLVFAFLVTMMAKAQAPNDAEALLDEVSSKVESYDNILIDFKYSLENTAENVKHETRGDVSLKGEKYLLNIMGTTRIFDGNKLYTIIPEDEEINISSYDPEDEQNITPSKMLTFYNDGYKSEMGKVEDLKGRKIQYVNLTPIDSNAEIKNILLGIDKQTKHIYNLIQTQDNGTKITITVNSFKTNQPLPESLFQFREDRYKDYYINRLD
ncbi:Outer membrane lipoprotein-sorting protein [Salinimicrobium catena]|uniref:Outer membrane lipoprotein-sorting protein n=1 Tax=Salinimicrobium catena TaxID=390640 RepID=A0A1H5L9S4_9FLAO|nr:outer membrane lipoprotein carrier protein LolA [Salinimicrobium catena]SDL07452.1 Outer membrane lipoprotein-sorting protein [Salinimicrobium catena]SEE73803.1 Outer membrane lipoprotein-sorting protein [Salinimicrobium catena]